MSSYTLLQKFPSSAFPTVNQKQRRRMGGKMALFQFLNDSFHGFLLSRTSDPIAAVFFIFPNATGRRMRKRLLDLPLPSVQQRKQEHPWPPAEFSLPFSLLSIARGRNQPPSRQVSPAYPKSTSPPQFFSKSLTITSGPCQSSAATWLPPLNSPAPSPFQCLHVFVTHSDPDNAAQAPSSLKKLVYE